MDRTELLDLKTVFKQLAREEYEELDDFVANILPTKRCSIEETYHDSSCWPEVRTINSYAILMGHLSMAVKGLGFLVVTWTTVVLLGGFVSVLGKKDFWCLAVITLTATAGSFDVFLNEKLRIIVNSIRPIGFLHLPFRNPLAYVANLVMSAVEAATFAIVLCPLFLVYMFGLYISAGLSLWRLKQHDYGNTNGDATKANLKPALDLLYSLALAQGVLFGYRFICYSWKRDFAKDVVSEYLFDELAATSVYKYVHDTRIGCEKNPSFAKERNFITYAVDLLQSEGSPENYLNGIRIMDTLIGAPRRKGIVLSKQFKCIDCKWYSFSWEDVQSFIQQNIMIRGLLIHSSSSSHILHKLLLSLDSTSPYDTEIRGRAARIVAHLADGIHLEQFPRGIHCIASLLNTCEEQPLLEPFERDWLLRTFGKSKIHESAHLFILPPSDLEEDCIKKKNKREKEDGDSELVTQGLRILKKLAANEENCRIISNTQGLLSKIMAPVTSDLLHQFDHGAWSDVVRESLRVMRQLVNATGETGTMLLEIISGNKEAMATVERILRCDFCKNSYPQLHKQAIRILIEMDASSTMSTGCRESIVKTLVGIFIDEGNVSGLRQFAGEKLATLCLQSRTSAKIVLQAHDDVIGNLTNILGQVKSKSSIPAAKYTGNFFFFGELADRGNKYRISASNRIHNNHRIIAAQVLEGICIHHSNDNDECLKEVMVDVMHKILSEILDYGEEKASSFSTEDEDIERQEVDVSEFNGKKYVSSSKQQYDGKLQAALLSLCVMICNTMISADTDLGLLFNKIGTGDGGDHTFNFVRNLKEMVERISSHRTAESLAILKLTTNMVTSMMQHRGSYANDELDSLMVALSNASKALSVIDGSMVFASQQDDGTMTRKTAKTLASLVKEAQELVDEQKKNHFLDIVPA